MEEYKEEQIHLRDYLRVILKRRWTIITVFFVVLITVLIQTYTATPIYETTTRLIIEKENPNVVSFQEVMTIDASDSDYYQTQYKIIESRSVARDVIGRLRLNESEEFYPKPKDDFISNLKRSIQETIDYWKESVASLLKTEDVQQPEDSESTIEVTDSTKEETKDTALVSAFLGRIIISPIRNSRLVDVGFRAKDPKLAAKIANTLAKAYVDQNLEIKLRAVKDAVRWLQNRIDEERKKVENAELALLRYKEKQGIITDFSDDAETITAEKLANLNELVVDSERKRVEAETRYKEAIALSGTPDMLDSIPEVMNNVLIRQIKTIEVELYKDMSELSKKYGQKHPQMVAIESELKTVQKRKQQEINRVINSLKNEYRVALASEKSLKAALANQKKESLDLNQKAIKYGVLWREVESARQMYELLINRFKETSLTEDMRTGNIRIVDRAEVPLRPVLPKRRLNIILAIIVGLVTGIGLAFFFEYLDNTIKLPEDIKRYLNVPYLGPVPAIALKENGNPADEIAEELVTFHSPKSTASEAYRGIRTGILFSSAEHQPQVISVTSSGPEEGKTLTLINLAVTMAQSGSKVIILDCDMRKPRLHALFGVSREIGMSNILVGGSSVKDAIKNTEIPNLDIIPCGPIPPNPSEILGSKRMESVLELLGKNYTRILLDSPPVTAVTDAVVLAKAVDGVLVVVRAGETPREIVQNGVENLRGVNANILGAILNGVNMGKDGYDYYQYYYYYYGEDEKKSKKDRSRWKAKSSYRE